MENESKPRTQYEIAEDGEIISNMQRRIAELASALAAMTAKYETWWEAYCKLDNINIQLNENIAELEKSRDEWRAKAETYELAAKMKEVLQAAKAKAEGVTLEWTEARQTSFVRLCAAENERLTERIAAMGAERDSTKSQLKEIEGQLKDMTAERDQLRAQLVHRHILGKVYDVTAESINRLAGELDEVTVERDELKASVSNGGEIDNLLKGMAIESWDAGFKIIKLEKERDQLLADVKEQCRLNGMGGSRELKLLTERNNFKLACEAQNLAIKELEKSRDEWKAKAEAISCICEYLPGDTGECKKCHPIPPKWADEQAGRASEEEESILIENWPDCIVEGCESKSCLALESPKCWPHTMIEALTERNRVLTEALEDIAEQATADFQIPNRGPMTPDEWKHLFHYAREYYLRESTQALQSTKESK